MKIITKCGRWQHRGPARVHRADRIHNPRHAAQLRGATRAELLKYATSGETTGDSSRVVGYAAVALRRPAAPKAEAGK